MRVPCSKCGVQILTETAVKNKGLCMPCKGGYRKQIEDGEKQRIEEREYLQSPERKYWIALVDRVFQTQQGIEGLSKQEKTYYAVTCLMGEVYNGGFDQFFSNSSGELYGLVLDGLFELGADQTAGLLTQAKDVLFGTGVVPLDRGKRLEQMPTIGNEGHPAWGKLALLDNEFYKDVERIAERCTAYAVSNRLYEED